MTERATVVALTVFSSLHVIVMTLPAAVIAVVAEKGGLPGTHGLDLVAVSAVLGLFHATVVWRRLRSELRHRVSALDAFIAEFDALVVLAVCVTGLVLVVLGGLAQTHSALVNQGWPVVGLWAVVLVASVAVAELVRTGVLRWLAAGRGPEETVVVGR